MRSWINHKANMNGDNQKEEGKWHYPIDPGACNQIFAWLGYWKNWELPLTPSFKPHKCIFEVFALLGDLLSAAPEKFRLRQRERERVGFGLGLRVSSSERHDCWRMLVGASERDACLLNKPDAFSKTIPHETDVVIRFQRRFLENCLWKIVIIYKNVTIFFRRLLYNRRRSTVVDDNC